MYVCMYEDTMYVTYWIGS